MVNPNKHLRTAYVNALNATYPTWDAVVPKNVVPVPEAYILITTQSKNITEENKGVTEDDDKAFEWLCTVTVDINSVKKAGFSSSLIADDMEEFAINVIEGLQTAGGFIIKQTRLIGSTSLRDNSSTESVNRIILIYEHWLDNID